MRRRLCILAALLVLPSCASRGVEAPAVTTDVGGSTLKNPPPQTVTVTENGEGNFSWNTTSAGPVKASRVNADGVTHIGTGVTRQLYLETSDMKLSLGSETDWYGKNLKVTKPVPAADGGTDEFVMFQADELGTQTSEPLRAFADVLQMATPIVEAVINGQRDVALRELEVQGAAIKAVSPDLFAWLTKLVSGI